MINLAPRKTYLKRISLLLYIAILFLTIFPVTHVANATNSNDQQILVSLGDSYSSGEGIEKFYGQDKSIAEKVKDTDWLAHRSQNSWPGRLTLPSVTGTMSKNHNKTWYFVATSGAVTKNLKCPQEREYKKIAYDELFFPLYDDSGFIAPQLDVFNKLGENTVDYVTLTLGGNDAGFADIIIAAATSSYSVQPSKLSNLLNNAWKEFYKTGGEIPNDPCDPETPDNRGIREKLRTAYQDIAEAAGPQARIIVAGYPKLLAEDGNNSFFSKEEASLFNDNVTRFNKEIETIVKSLKASGMKITFVSVEEAFNGHEAYSEKPFINNVIFGKKPQDLSDFGISSSYSIHPNNLGAEAYAKCVQDKIDELEKDGGQSEWPVRTTSDKRDIVLVLDASGSMEGVPIQETKIASEKFITTILKEDASIGIVTFDYSAMKISDFNKKENYLIEAMQGLNAGGGTNIESGLSTAYDMLQNNNAEKKIIVLMSDGEPNGGKVGEELIAYANSIKDEGIYIYTLGFFEDLSSKHSAQKLMERIASEGSHYEVADASSLVFFFGDIADQINGQKYIYVRIACPVDVIVSYNGETLSSVEDDLNVRTGFGSLTFEESESNSENNNDNRIKILRLKEGTDYYIRLEGSGRGRMNYTIGFMDENGEYSDLRKFTNIKITKKTVIDTVASNSDTTVLNIDEDGDGKYDLKYRANENGRGKIVDHTLIYIGIGVLAFALLLIIFISIKKRNKKNRNI